MKIFYIAFFILLVLPVNKGYACSCYSNKSYELKDNKYVFIGKVDKLTDADDNVINMTDFIKSFRTQKLKGETKDHFPKYNIKFKVYKSWKGIENEEFTISSIIGDGASCEGTYFTKNNFFLLHITDKHVTNFCNREVRHISDSTNNKNHNPNEAVQISVANLGNSEKVFKELPENLHLTDEDIEKTSQMLQESKKRYEKEIFDIINELGNIIGLSKKEIEHTAKNCSKKKLVLLSPEIFPFIEVLAKTLNLETEKIEIAKEHFINKEIPSDRILKIEQFASHKKLNRSQLIRLKEAFIRDYGLSEYIHPNYSHEFLTKKSDYINSKINVIIDHPEVNNINYYPIIYKKKTYLPDQQPLTSEESYVNNYINRMGFYHISDQNIFLENINEIAKSLKTMRDNSSANQ